MTPDQTLNIVDLLSAANVLNRLEDRTPEVWAAALGDLDYRDCMTAAAHLIRTERWVKIADLRDAVHSLREERLTKANLVYDGNPNESAEQYTATLRSLRSEVASGRIPQHGMSAAIARSSTAELPPGRGRAAIEAVSRSATPQRPGVVNVLAVTCPRCSALPGRSCTTRGKRRSDVHPSRLDDARRAAAGQPLISHDDIEREQQRRLDASRAALDRLAALEDEDAGEP